MQQLQKEPLEQRMQHKEADQDLKRFHVVRKLEISVKFLRRFLKLLPGWLTDLSLILPSGRSQTKSPSIGCWAWAASSG